MPLMVGSDVLFDYTTESVREHTRLVPERLSRTGWNYVTPQHLGGFSPIPRQWWRASYGIWAYMQTRSFCTLPAAQS